MRDPRESNRGEQVFFVNLFLFAVFAGSGAGGLLFLVIVGIFVVVNVLLFRHYEREDKIYDEWRARELAEADEVSRVAAERKLWNWSDGKIQMAFEERSFGHWGNAEVLFRSVADEGHPFFRDGARDNADECARLARD